MKKLFMVLSLMLFSVTCQAYQASINVPDGTGASVRANLNNALQAITTGQAGTTAPTVTYPYMVWVDQSTVPRTLRIMNGSNTAWIAAATIDDTGNVYSVANAVTAITCTGNAATATNATKLLGMNWAWSGQYGQPTWLWGGSDGTNIYVYNPSNFNVAAAATATTAINSAATGSIPYTRDENGLRIIRGTINNGAIVNGAGFSVVRNSTGNYTVTFANAFSSAPSLGLAVFGTGMSTINRGSVTSSNFNVIINSDNIFDFIAIGPN